MQGGDRTVPRDDWRIPLPAGRWQHDFDVFLSHSGADRLQVLRVYFFLTYLGIKCFYDKRRVQLSVREEIAGGLARCRHLVAFGTKSFFDWELSQWPSRELWTFLAAKGASAVSVLCIGMDPVKMSSLGRMVDLHYQPHKPPLESGESSVQTLGRAVTLLKVVRPTADTVLTTREIVDLAIHLLKELERPNPPAVWEQIRTADRLALRLDEAASSQAKLLLEKYSAHEIPPERISEAERAVEHAMGGTSATDAQPWLIICDSAGTQEQKFFDTEIEADTYWKSLSKLNGAVKAELVDGHYVIRAESTFPSLAYRCIPLNKIIKNHCEEILLRLRQHVARINVTLQSRMPRSRL